MALDHFTTRLETNRHNSGFLLFHSHHLGPPMQQTTLRLVQHYCLNHANITSSAPALPQLLDLSLGLYVARALNIQHVQDDFSRVGLASPFCIDTVTKQVDQALSRIDWSAVLQFNKQSDEFLCNALVLLHIFHQAGIHSLEPHRPRIEVTLQIRRFTLLTKAADWKSQCHLVTHILLSCSDWGKNKLEAASYSLEFNFILANLPRAIAEENVKLTGEFLHCLGILEHDLTNAQRASVKVAKEFLSSVVNFDDDVYRTWCILEEELVAKNRLFAQ